MTTTVAALIVIILTLYSWYRGGKFREIALDAAKGLCQRSNVELLDDKISLFKVKICRDFDKRIKCLRAYTFEYTNPDINDRQLGFVALMGPVIILRRLEIASFDSAMHKWLKEESFKRKHKIKFLLSFGSVRAINRSVATGESNQSSQSNNSHNYNNASNIKSAKNLKPSNDNNIVDFKSKREEKLKKIKSMKPKNTASSTDDKK